MQISAYLIIGILLGYFFGWLITKIYLTQKYQGKLDQFISTKSVDVKELDKVKAEIFKYKKENKLLKAQNARVSSGYDGQKYVLDQHNETLDEFQKRLLSKDGVIETLTSKLSEVEEKQRNIEKQYEEEIDAFMFERIELTKKYKDLLEKHTAFKKHQGMLKEKESWFSKFFSIPSNVH